MSRNQPTTRTYFVSGHLDITEEEFKLYYVPELQAAVHAGASFVMGDARGADTMAQTFLDPTTSAVTVFHMATKPRNCVSSRFFKQGGFSTDLDRDTALTAASTHDIAWIRPEAEQRKKYGKKFRKNRVSGTLANLRRRSGGKETSATRSDAPLCAYVRFFIRSSDHFDARLTVFDGSAVDWEVFFKYPGQPARARRVMTQGFHQSFRSTLTAKFTRSDEKQAISMEGLLLVSALGAVFLSQDASLDLYLAFAPRQPSLNSLNLSVSAETDVVVCSDPTPTSPNNIEPQTSPEVKLPDALQPSFIVAVPHLFSRNLWIEKLNGCLFSLEQYCNIPPSLKPYLG